MVLWDIDDRAYLEKLGMRISQSVARLGSTAMVSASIGACQGACSYHDLIKRADSAMYQVKRGGKGGFFLG